MSFDVCITASPPGRFRLASHWALSVEIPLERTSFSITTAARTNKRCGRRDIIVAAAGHVAIIERLQRAESMTLSFSAELASAAGGTVPLFDQPFVLRDELLTRTADAIRRRMADESMDSALLSAFATVVAGRVVFAAARRRTRSGAMSTRQLDTIDRHLRKHLDRPIQIAELSSLIALSPRQLVRRFQATRGVTPRAYIAQQRIRRAAHLLESTALSITEVALEVGLTASHFTRTFTRRYGRSPREFRRDQRAGTTSRTGPTSS